MKNIKKAPKKLKAKKMLRNFWNRLFPLLTVLFGILLVLISLSVLIDKLLGGQLRPDSRFQDNTMLVEAPNVINVSNPKLISAEGCESCASLILEIQSFSPKERHLEGVIHINIPDSLKKEFWSNSEYIVIPDNDYPDKLILKDKYKSLEIILTISSSFLPNSETKTNIPLIDFFDGPVEGAVSAPVSINFSGESKSYPEDWYYSSNYFSLQLPNELWLLKDAKLGGTIPVIMYISSGFQMRDFSVNAKLDTQKSSMAFLLLEMLIARDDNARYYIWSMALLPCLLGAIFVHSNFSNRKKREKLTGFLFLEVSAVIFSVLPLRTVLVPSYFDSLVSVDLLLGFGITCIVLTALIVYARETYKSK